MAIIKYEPIELAESKTHLELLNFFNKLQIKEEFSFPFREACLCFQCHGRYINLQKDMNLKQLLEKIEGRKNEWMQLCETRQLIILADSIELFLQYVKMMKSLVNVEVENQVTRSIIRRHTSDIHNLSTRLLESVENAIKTSYDRWDFCQEVKYVVDGITDIINSLKEIIAPLNGSPNQCDEIKG